MNNLKYIFVFLIFLCSSCQKAKKSPWEASMIYRKSDDDLFSGLSIHAPAPPIYPWSGRYMGTYFRITKDFFRCKGASDHPILVTSEVLSDCDGLHSLPLKEGVEHIYPILIDLLNVIQKETGKQVVITTGHRCAKHNQYADQRGYNRSSKHMIGAEVDFYVKGMETSPLEIVKIIESYYQNDPEVKEKKEFIEFQRYTKGDLNVREAPWYNKEIFVKLYQVDEGRDFDNSHGFPYLSLQVRYDRKKNELVRFSWDEVEKLLHEK